MLAQAPDLELIDGQILAQTTEHPLPHAQLDAKRAQMFDRDVYEKMRARYEGQFLPKFECDRITYASDGLRITGFLLKKRGLKTSKLPAIIYNRGGNRSYGMLDADDLMSFAPLLEAGYVVVASQYRGNDGGEGQEDYGGADLHDVTNLVPLLGQLGYVDLTRLFMIGFSRGGMMTFMAAKAGVPLRAVVGIGPLTDIRANTKERMPMQKVLVDLIPNLDTPGSHAREDRSAIAWPELIRAPVLLLQGTNDAQVDVKLTRAFRRALEKSGSTVRMVEFKHGNHALFGFDDRVNREVLGWFKRFDQSPASLRR